MSRGISGFGSLVPQDESQENEEFQSSMNSFHIPLPRSPLISIPNPSQFCNEPHVSDFDSKDSISGTAPATLLLLLSKKKLQLASSDNLGKSVATPKTSNRHGKLHSEPNSAQSMPATARVSSRVSLGGAMGASAIGPKTTRGKEIISYSCRSSRGNSAPNHNYSVQVPCFELEEDSFFWADHNVQVLIRIRPLNTAERTSQGYERCLRQENAHTIEWLCHPETRFTFDHIAGEAISQEKLFKVVGLPMVENCMSGYNSCMFAYGQTGSGKTHTMMGEIKHMDSELSEDSGITTRVFDYLFSRIMMEEESRRDEKLKFSCKCSFLEIYNEQIIDLLEPSSTNLQLREDPKKGVYVENLTESTVRTVKDVIKLLLQGTANKKMAATHMNSESSRSHTVFTCIIESYWEKDSMTHFRFARLNLVDLAGSERQKSSGAEGDRLKEAANINKSLSTLGLVIMSLVDLAHGKQRHVPYRDSRLTFLLQDSLGGNSKTTIIANVSPSICSAHETLSTLKFAQRAKLIQNNAKVNEDASGDVNALQQQIQQLKDQLSLLMKHHNLSGSQTNCLLSFGESKFPDSSEMHNYKEERTICSHSPNFQNKKMRSIESALVGALRREKIAETALRKLEAKIENLNLFAWQREEDVQHAKMMLRFREEKIKQLELLVDGSLLADHYLMEESKALKEEIQLLQARTDKNPEMTRFARENIRLVEQLQLYQNFYEHGERQTLLAEISDLRDQLLEAIEREPKLSSRLRNQDNDSLKELEDCRTMNSKLIRQVDEPRELRKYLHHNEAALYTVTSHSSKDPEEIRHTDKYSLVGSVFGGSDSGDEASLSNADNITLKNRSDHNEQNQMLIEIMNTKHNVESQSAIKCGSGLLELESPKKHNKGVVKNDNEDSKGKELLAKLEKVTGELEEARLVNCQYQEDQASLVTHHHQVELVREEVEIETAKTILHLQEEVTTLQLKLNERLCSMTKENLRLRNSIAAKEAEMSTLSGEWERAILELTSFLLDGSKSLRDASGEIENIICSFPQLNIQISENVEKTARACIDKEETILLLEKSLEDAQKTVTEMEVKLNSLKEATMVLNNLPYSDNDQSKSMLLTEKINMAEILECNLKLKEEQFREAEKCADAAFLVVKLLSDCEKVGNRNDMKGGIPSLESVSTTEMGFYKIDKMNSYLNTLSMDDIKSTVELESLIKESADAISACYRDLEVYLAGLQTDILEASTTCMKLVKDMVNEIQDFRSKFTELKGNHTGYLASRIGLQALEPLKFISFEGQLHIFHPIKDELAIMNHQLKLIEHTFKTNLNARSSLLSDEYLIEADNYSVDSTSGDFTSASDSPTAIVSLGDKIDELANTCCSNFSEEITDQIVNQYSSIETESEHSMKIFKKSNHNNAMTCLRKELGMAFHAFTRLHVRLNKILNRNDIKESAYTEDMKGVVPSCGLMKDIAEACCYNFKEVVAGEKFDHASTFLRKCEEARETMKEADFMLNELMSANEKANKLNGMWKQASEELVVQRLHLIEENEQLKSQVFTKERENRFLLDEICHYLVEVMNSFSSVEVCFLQMQRELEDRYKVWYSEVLSMGKDMLYFVCNSRSSLEDISSEIMAKEFSACFQYQYIVEEIIHKAPSFKVQHSFYPLRKQNVNVCNTAKKICSTDQDKILITKRKGIKEGDQNQMERIIQEDLVLSHDNMINENFSLKKVLERKEVLLNGLLFDFSLLQEVASDRRDIKDENEKLVLALATVRQELETKTRQLDDLLVQYRKVESHLVDSKNASFLSNSELEQTKETINTLSDQNAELRILLKDVYLRKSEAEGKLEEQKVVNKELENEIIHLNSSVERKVHSSIQLIEEDLRKVSDERDQLSDKLDMAQALADENEAIAVEARQESEASKIYAEQKEEEIQILEHSIEELESTINVLEKKVYEMDKEVERHRLIRDSLELELQVLRQRLSTVESFTDTVETENLSSMHNEDSITRQLHSRILELHEAHSEIKLLEMYVAEKDKEIKQYKEHISELVLHSEAQALQYQKKFRTLEAMVLEVKTNISNSASVALTVDKFDKSAMRTRGSSSPFRCIASLVQQMNLEKDEELLVARHRIEELEALLAGRQKEVCMLNARLAAVESMTHDVIRDLLGVKLDMTNYANLVNQHQVEILVEEAHQQKEAFLIKEQEIENLRKQINDLVEEREGCIDALNKKVADILAVEMKLEQLQERDHLLHAQNDLLKVDKNNLLRRVAELDEMVKALLGAQNAQQGVQLPSKTMVNAALRVGLAPSEKLLARANVELAQYRKASGGSHPNGKVCGNGLESKHRK